MSLVVRPPDALFLPPSIVPKWRGLRGLEVPEALAPAALAEEERHQRPAGRGLPVEVLQPRPLLGVEGVV